MQEFEPKRKTKIFTKEFLSKYAYIFVLAILLVGGISYGLTFFIQNKKITTGSISLADLTINFTDRTINATGLSVPNDDAEGLTEYSKSLTITNTTSVDGRVTLKLTRTSGLDLTDLRYAIKVNGAIQEIGDVPSTGEILETAIMGNETIDVEVRLWPKTTYSGSETTFVGEITPEIKYFGSKAVTSIDSPAGKYVNFNCNNGTCEKWQIVKVEDGRLVLTTQANYEGATSRTNSNRYDSTLGLYDDGNLITSTSTDGKNVYLAKTVKITGGDGTINNPYVLTNSIFNEEDKKVVAVVTYKDGNNNTLATQSIYYNEDNYMSYNSNVITSWMDNSNNLYTYGDLITVTSDTNFTPGLVNVTYDYSENGGTSSTKTTDSIVVNSQVDLTPVATKSGWTFVGWNTDKNATSALSTLAIGTSDITIYAIYRKEAINYTATFNPNGNGTSSLSTPTGCTKDSSTGVITCSCTIAAVYNNATQGVDCSITSPTITAPSNTPNVCGYTTSTTGVSTGCTTHNSSMTLTSNPTYYAQTYNNAITHTATFNPNGNTLNQPSGCSKNSSTGVVTCQCTRATTYNGTAQNANCSITKPTITAPSNTPTVCGYTTSTTGTTSCSVASGGSLTLTSNPTYYAQSYKSSITHTAIFNPNGNTLNQPSGCSKNSSTGVVTCQCTRATTYNGTAQNANCSITKPTITAPSNTPTVCGYTTSTAGTTSCSVASGGSLTLTSNPTYYAQSYKAGVTYTVTYAANGGNSTPSNGTCSTNTVYNGTSQGTCSITLASGAGTKSGYVFAGWKSSTNNQVYNAGASYTPTANTTMTAQWALPPICKRVTSTSQLHTETCKYTSGSNYCYADGYYSGGSKNTTTITYGTIWNGSSALKAGDAFDCDVNNDGTYDSTTERFYYVSDRWTPGTNINTFDTNTAVLIYYSNFSNGAASDRAEKYHASDNWHGPVTAATHLPKTTGSNAWRSDLLTTRSRMIYACTDDCGTTPSLVTEGGTITPNPYNYGSTTAARLLTLPEAVKGCKALNNNTSLRIEGSLTVCNFFFEKTQYARSSSFPYSTIGIWLENPYTYFEKNVFNLDAYSRYLAGSDVDDNMTVGVRPVIEVPKSKIQ